MLDQLVIAMARWYLYEMPTTERDGFTWEVYTDAVSILRELRYYQ